ncbi:hypothetical protein [Arthrobacter methylotrophus]|uniref:Uncharacterized protein n=1 Tax=Arthrobacter methylotrophus TaxID=121291 RepID=A0ABV5UP06_9MICC
MKAFRCPADIGCTGREPGTTGTEYTISSDRYGYVKLTPAAE